MSARAAARPWTLARGYNALLLPPALFLAIFFLWPLARVVARSLTEPALSWQNYARVFGDGPYLVVLWNTIETAMVVTALCLAIAYPLAFAMARMSGWRLRLAMALVIIPLWTSVVVRSYGWMVVFQREGMLNGLLQWLGLVDAPFRFLPGAIAVHVGMVHIMLPFMILPLVASMRAIDPALLRAADVLGASPRRRFVEIFLPLSMPGVSAGVALVFMTSLGFFITPALLGGPRHMMAAVLIEQQANVQLNWPLASALSTTLLLVTSAIYLAYLRATRGRAASW
jgi:ABC-type spermidine/putrescine transport system permease subunit I